ncbi:MAG: DUF222 domain-containing protein, partial [Propionibacteriaceae bacterium]
DGLEPLDDTLQQDRRYLELKQRRDGMWHLAGRLTATLGAQLNAIVEPLAKPRSSSIDDEHGKTTQFPDQRPSMQRLHDALDEACAKLLKSADLPSVGGVPASEIITITLEDLLGNTGAAETADGSQLTADQLRRIADEADIWPLITTSHGVPLALVRSQRLASKGQTNLNNLTLLCRYHHTHFLQKGWTCRINENGLPEWIPPRWIDADQQPHINARIQRIHTQRELDRRDPRRTPTAA